MRQFLVVLPVVLAAAFPFAASAQSIGEAVDNQLLIWGTSEASSQPWFHQTEVTRDGIDAARSGAITHGEQSDLTANVVGPGTLSFWWKVSSEYDGASGRCDTLSFWYDASSAMTLTFGESNWNHRTYLIPPGSHTLNWSYSKDFSGSAGLDAAFLDQVVWTPFFANTPPTLSTEMGESPRSSEQLRWKGDFFLRAVSFDGSDEHGYRMLGDRRLVDRRSDRDHAETRHSVAIWRAGRFGRRRFAQSRRAERAVGPSAVRTLLCAVPRPTFAGGFPRAGIGGGAHTDPVSGDAPAGGSTGGAAS